MVYRLEEINNMVRQDPSHFSQECDRIFSDKVEKAAEAIGKNIGKSPIVLLSGPSASGKTTTAMKLADALGARGIKAHAVAMDKYFKTIDPQTAARTPEGDIDFESIECLDLQLLDEHFMKLGKHEEIRIPSFDFAKQRRSETKFRDLRLGKNEIVIFEGIHALNSRISDRHPEAFRLFVSVNSSVDLGNGREFEDIWTRLMRRVVRDHYFRGADAAFTLSLWDNIKRGEKVNILPFVDTADFSVDSFIPYEISLLSSFSLPLLERLDPNTPHYDTIMEIADSARCFEPIGEKLVAPSSLLREFIGGGIYKY